MTSILIFGLFLVIVTSCNCYYPSSTLCRMSHLRTIPLSLREFPGNSVFYQHAVANSKRMVYDSKCIKATLSRSPYNEIHAKAYMSQQNLRSGAISTMTKLMIEHCPGIWEYQEENNGSNYNINYILWADGQSLVYLRRLYRNGQFFDDAFLFLSTMRYVTKEYIEWAFGQANVKIYSLTLFSQENCRDYSYRKNSYD